MSQVDKLPTKPMYKVLMQGAKIPCIAGNNRVVQLHYNVDHELPCAFPSLQKDFDALVKAGVLKDLSKPDTKTEAAAEAAKAEAATVADKKDKVINK